MKLISECTIKYLSVFVHLLNFTSVTSVSSKRIFNFSITNLVLGHSSQMEKKQLDDAFSQTKSTPFIFSCCIIPCNFNFIFWWILHTHTLCVPLLLAKMHSRRLICLNLGKEISISGNFSLNCLCKSLRLKSSFLLLYSFPIFDNWFVILYSRHDTAVIVS